MVGVEGLAARSGRAICQIALHKSDLPKGVFHFSCDERCGRSPDRATCLHESGGRGRETGPSDKSNSCEAHPLPNRFT